MNDETRIYGEIMQLIDQLHEYRKGERAKKRENSPHRVPYAGRVFDEKEIKAGVSAVLDGWLTWGKHGEVFEQEIAKKMGCRYAVAVNSGSSANLVAFSTLASPHLKNPLRPGDEIITTAVGFPTTLNPIIQNQCVPVFIDVELGHYTPRLDQVEAAIGPRTRGIFLAHTLGVPFDIKGVQELCKQHDLFLIEDNCDAFGSLYDGQYTGSFGDLSSLSMYPAHQITMGEGGVVFTNDSNYYRIAKSLRDWGRDCWCPSGMDNTCKKRFSWNLGTLPEGYDHKYIYTQIGYNLKPTDIQGAIGRVQLQKLESFTKARQINWEYLKSGLSHLEEYFVLPIPTHMSQPSWFAFMLLVRDSAPFSKKDIVHFLEREGIQTRPLFAGNLLRHPAYEKITHRISGTLENADRILQQGFFMGVYPELDKAQLDHMINCVDLFCNKFSV